MKFAFVFPGQGSQYVGMGKEIYHRFSSAREVFERADSCLGFKLSFLCFQGPEDELSKTVNAQPALLTTSIAYLQVVKEFGLEPGITAGHSLGEYSALVAAGSLAFEDALQLVRKRGQFMQEAVPLGAGGMAAVMGLAIEKVREACAEAATLGVVEAVNINSPGQVVIAGENDALDRACKAAGDKGARKCKKLTVSAPFHSSLMVRAGERLAVELDRTTIADPNIPIVANVNAGIVKSGDEIRQALKEQVYSPVLWQESMEKIARSGFRDILEVGPGKVLTGLMRKIDRECRAFNTDAKEDIDAVLTKVQGVHDRC